MAKKSSNGNGSNSTVLDIPVEFGQISLGDQTGRIGITIDRSTIKLDDADRCFCGHRLVAKLVLGGKGDANGQKHFVDDLHDEVDGVFDCKRIGVGPKEISTGLTFSLEDTDLATIAQFSKKSGRVVVRDVQAIPEEAPKGDDTSLDDDDDDDDTDDLDETALTSIYTAAKCKMLATAGLHTVGELTTYIRETPLTGIKGISARKAEAMDAKLAQWIEDHPG